MRGWMRVRVRVVVAQVVRVLGALHGAGGVSQSQLPRGPWGLGRRGDRRAGSAVAGLFRLVTERVGPRGLMGLASGGARAVVVREAGTGERLAGRRRPRGSLASCPIKKKASPFSQKGWLGSGLFNECFSSFGRAPHAWAGRGEDEAGEGGGVPKLASEREGQAANSRRSGCNVEVEDSPPDQVELDGQPA